MKKTWGALMLVLSALTTAVVLMLAQVAARFDEADGDYIDWKGQIPGVVYLLLAVAFGVAIWLMSQEEKPGGHRKLDD